MRKFLKSRWLPWSLFIGTAIGTVVGLSWRWDVDDK